MSTATRDIFICHASEDKDAVVRPMVEAFTRVGVTSWYDEAEIIWGDSITSRVNEGLASSRYVIVVLSSIFITKNWPQREMNAALNAEASSGEVRVLPLLVGNERDIGLILERYPLLNDKRYLPWDGDLRKIVDAMLLRLGGPNRRAEEEKRDARSLTVGLRVPLPEIKKQFSQRDRDMYLREAFDEIKRYFQQALDELNSQYQEADIDFMEVHALKFICTIYIRGDVANRCKIWMGGGRGMSDSIAYNSGQFSIDSDDSYNDLVSVNDDERSLGIQVSGFSYGAQEFPGSLLTPAQAAEYLWRRFTDHLG